MTGKDQVKWYCPECNEKTKRSDGIDTVTNEMLMTFMKNMNQNLTDIMTQLSLKADKTETSKINKQLNELDKRIATQMTGIDERIVVLENTTKEAPPPAQPPISKEAEREMVARATNELKEHGERKNNVIIFNMPESRSNLKTECRKHDLDLAVNLSKHCGEFQDDDIVDIKRLGKKSVENTRPTIVKFKDEQTKARLMTNLVNLKNAEDPYKSMRIQHDMTPQERETEKQLILEAKAKSENDEGNFFYVVRGLPGNRNIVKVLRRRIGREDANEEEEEY